VRAICYESEVGVLMKNFSQSVWRGAKQFCFKPIDFVFYSFIIFLVLQCDFLARMFPFATENLIIYTLVTLLVIISSVVISINLFGGRERFVSFTVYLGPVLLIWEIFSASLWFNRPASSTDYCYAHNTYLLKLLGFWLFMTSLWTAIVARSYFRIKALLNPTASSLVAAIDAHESSTGGHSKRVAALARIIGKWYGMNPDDLERLWLAGSLHDMGKLSIPKEILKKRGPLNESEWTLIRRHPQNGVKIITPLKINWCEQAILQHHERPDGTGYPCGLCGAETIDLLARIIAVADTFDAITSHRYYRPAKSFAEARDIILGESGKQFDPECVDAFMKAFPELVRVSMDQAEAYV
jgi:HD-GYP domain-containing protein (c-di-GMP phosphodiesterase class II)